MTLQAAVAIMLGPTVPSSLLSRAIFHHKNNDLQGSHDRGFIEVDNCGRATDLSLARVRSWTEVQLDFSASKRDNQNEKILRRQCRVNPSATRS